MREYRLLAGEPQCNCGRIATSRTLLERGDFVTIGLQGDSGKPRPGQVIQAGGFEAFATLTVLTVLPVTSSLLDVPMIRLTVEADDRKMLAGPSQVRAGKAVTVGRDKGGPVVGKAGEEPMSTVSRALAEFPGIA